MRIWNKEEIDTVTETKDACKAQEKEVIVCAACYQEITESELQIMIDDSFTHVFANPHGIVFEIGCFSQAKGCHAGSLPSDDFSWFSGFEWQVGVCTSCLCHLGWIFTNNTQRFYGLILDKLIFP